jgi:hypothetical protein
LEYYKRVERLKFSVQNKMGNVSNAIWSVVVSNPELEGLKKINAVAAARALPAGEFSHFETFPVLKEQRHGSPGHRGGCLLRGTGHPHRRNA